MIKQRLNQSDYLAIVANLIPVYGVWFLGWSAREAFIVYALETLIIGAFTVLKLLIATLFKGTDTWYNNQATSQVSGIVFILFFILHFGLFAAVQTALFSAAADINSPGTGSFYFLLHWYDYINRDITLMLCAFIVSHAARDLVPFLVKGQHRTMPMVIIMFQPYGRIFIQQFIVILGSMFLSFGLDKIFIVVFALVKIFFEVYLNFDSILNKTMADLKKGSGEKN